MQFERNGENATFEMNIEERQCLYFFISFL